MEAVVFIGIQGSGKTSFYRERFFETHLRLSLDQLRTRHRERVLLETCLRLGQRFVIDNTNVTVADRARYLAPGRAAKFRVVGYFFEPDPEGAWARNLERREAHRVPPAGFYGTLQRLQRPSAGEGFDALYRVWIPEPGEFAVEPWAGG